MQDDDYEVSAAYVDEMLKPVKAAGHFEAVLAELPPRTKAMVLAPWSEQWHPAGLTETLAMEIVKVAGEPFFAEMIYQTVKKRFGPIIVPMLTSALKKGNPAMLLFQLDGLVAVAIKGIEIVWKGKQADTNGSLWVTYPRPVGEVMQHSWRGVLKFVFEVTRRKYQIDAFQRSPTGHKFEYRVSWSAEPEPEAPPPAPPEIKSR